MPGSGPNWGLDLNRTAPHPGSSPVQGPVHGQARGSGPGFTLGWVCCEPGPDRTAPRTYGVGRCLCNHTKSAYFPHHVPQKTSLTFLLNLLCILKYGTAPPTCASRAVRRASGHTGV
jgi:hypothetical protein